MSFDIRCKCCQTKHSEKIKFISSSIISDSTMSFEYPTDVLNHDIRNEVIFRVLCRNDLNDCTDTFQRDSNIEMNKFHIHMYDV